jgi:hypothetical protein
MVEALRVLSVTKRRQFWQCSENHISLGNFFEEFTKFGLRLRGRVHTLLTALANNTLADEELPNH